MGLYALPKVLADLIKIFKSAPEGKTLGKGVAGWEFVDPPVGTPGEPGTPGADGASAYDIAVSNGFVGTEAQWLASLEGAVGAQGIQGDPGPAGDPVSREGLKTYHGFVTRANSTLAFNNATRTFTLGNTAPHDVWHNGVKTTINAAKTVQIGAGLGQHFVWMTAAGALASSQVVWDLLDTAIIFVATVHWDGATGIVADERHDYRRNLLENRNQHESWGAQYVSGFTPTPTFTDANTFTFAGGVIRDEDLYHTLTTPQTQCRIGYRVAGGATMTFDAAGTGYAKLNAGVPRYDNAGTLTNLPVSNYMNHWVYATNRPDTPVVVVLGQNAYSTVAAAQNGAQPTLAGLSVAEWKLLYRVVVQNLAGALKFIQADVMYNLSTGPAINAGSPTTLSAGNVTVNTANFGGNLTAAETNVQAALEKIDDLALGSGDFLSPLSTAEISITGATAATISRMHVCSGSTVDYTVALPLATAGRVIGFRMSSALTKLVTLDAGIGGLIDGQRYRVMWANETCLLLGDGTNWTKIAGKSLPLQAGIYAGTAQSIPNVTVTKIVTDTQAVAPSVAVMQDLANKRIQIARAGLYTVTYKLRWAGNNGSPFSYNTYTKLNGATLFAISGYAAAVEAPFTGMTESAPLAVNDLLELYGYFSGGFFEGVATVAGSSSTFLKVTEQPTW